MRFPDRSFSPSDCYYPGETVEEAVMTVKEVIEAHQLALKEDDGGMSNEESLLLEERKSVRGFTKIVPDVHSKGLDDAGKVVTMGEAPVLVDVRGMLDLAEAERRGFYYRRL